jgi:hypothetical protein
MALLAKPNHIKRQRIVVMVAVNTAARPALCAGGWLYDPAIANGVV